MTNDLVIQKFRLMGRNPRTGAPVHVPEMKIPHFRQGYEIRKRPHALAPMAEKSEQISSA
jgi:hypothetical protein